MRIHGPALAGSTSAIANTATGPMANHESPIPCNSRAGAVVRRTMSGTRASVTATSTASGTMAIGVANSSGTNASCVGTVKPIGVSNCTRVASTNVSTQRAAGRNSNPTGGWAIQTARTAAQNPIARATTVPTSRRVIRALR